MMFDGTLIQPVVAVSPSAIRQMKWDDGAILPDGGNDQRQSPSSTREVQRSVHDPNSGQAGNRRRMLTWSSGGELRRYDREAEERARGSKTRTTAKRRTESGALAHKESASGMGMEMGLGLGLVLEPGLETRSDDDQLELGLELEPVQAVQSAVPTRGNKKARRQMQNRIAQRAFRARLKVQHQEVSWDSQYTIASCLDT
jgi:hypothetical protein